MRVEPSNPIDSGPTTTPFHQHFERYIRPLLAQTMSANPRRRTLFGVLSIPTLPKRFDQNPSFIARVKFVILTRRTLLAVFRFTMNSCLIGTTRVAIKITSQIAYKKELDISSQELPRRVRLKGGLPKWPDELSLERSRHVVIRVPKPTPQVEVSQAGAVSSSRPFALVSVCVAT